MELKSGECLNNIFQGRSSKLYLSGIEMKDRGVCMSLLTVSKLYLSGIEMQDLQRKQLKLNALNCTLVELKWIYILRFRRSRNL